MYTYQIWFVINIVEMGDGDACFLIFPIKLTILAAYLVKWQFGREEL